MDSQNNTIQTVSEGQVEVQSNSQSNHENQHILSHPQISLLQGQIRLFKNLTKRYVDSKFAKQLPENEMPSAISSAPVPVPSNSTTVTTAQTFSTNTTFGAPMSTTNNAPQFTGISNPSHIPMNTAPSAPSHTSMLVPQPPQSAPQPTAREPAPTIVPWRPLSATLHCGPKVLPEGAVGTSSLDQSCLDSSAQPPLLLTRPYAATLRELTLSRLSSQIPSPAMEKLLATNHWQMQALEKQRRLVIESFPIPSAKSSSDATPADDSVTQAVAWRSFVRTKVVRRDVRNYEREEKRKRGEQEDKRRKKVADFHKTLFLHRDEFLRFHKAKRGECGKVARAVRIAEEQREARKEKDLARADARRMQALRENDMEAYSKLLQDTKNDRLHYILQQADTYIASINEMVIEHSRNVAAGDDMDEEQAGDGATDPTSLSKASSAAKDMYRNVHRRQEIVTQPRSLAGGELKEYQLSGVQWLVSLYNNKLNGILADEMGLGKTIQTIALLTYLMEKKNNRGPFMVVVPLSTLSNWVNEFSKWAPHMIKIVYKGTPVARRQMFRDEIEGGAFNVLLTTYEYIMKDKGYLRRLTWQYIIVDEGHRMKNKESKFAQTLGTLYQARHRVLLTGTPLQNNVHELWALLNFLLPEIFHSSESFETWFNKPFASFKKQGPPGALEQEQNEMAGLSEEETILLINKLHEVIRPFMLRRVKQDVLDQLPEKVEKIVRCGLSGFQRRIYTAIASRTIKDKDKDGDDEGGTSGLNNALMQLRKVCNHPYLFLSEWYADEDLVRASGKFELLNRMLPKLLRAGHRVLMFSQHTQVMTILERFFDMRGFRHLRLDGSTPADEREKRMYMFNDPDSPYFIFLLSTRAGGLGLNLATADTVILFDSDWNPMMDAQAQDRAHRIGQKNEVRVFRLVSASPVEERILAQAAYKKNRATITIELSGANAMGKQAENPDKDVVMKSLLQEMNSNVAFTSNVILPSMSGGAGGGEDGDEEEEEEELSDLPTEELLNEMMATNEADLELYRRMDKEQPPSGLPPLMTGEETPAWLMPHHWAKNAQLLDCMRQDSAEAAGQAGPKKVGRKKSGLVDEDDGMFLGGKLMRKRKDLQYDDGLTEKQFMRMMERHADAGGDLNAVGTASAEPPSGKNRFNPVADGSVPVLRALQTADYAFLRKLLNDEISGAPSADGARDASALFLQKPDKKLYPDYYLLIPEPISLKEICAELKRKAYLTLADLEFDLCLMALNARTFNSEASFVFLDVQHLRRVFYQRCIEQGLLVGIELSVDSLDERGALMELPPLPQSYALLLQEAASGEFVSKSSLQALSIAGASGSSSYPATARKSVSKSASKVPGRPRKSVSEASFPSFADAVEPFEEPSVEPVEEPKSAAKGKRKLTLVHRAEPPADAEATQKGSQTSKSRPETSNGDSGASTVPPPSVPQPRLVLSLSKKSK